MNRKRLLIGATAAVMVAGGWFIAAEPANAGQYSVTSNDAAAVPHVRHGFVTGRTRSMQAHSDEFGAGYTADGKTYTSVTGEATAGR
jgi:hypothetical protein